MTERPVPGRAARSTVFWASQPVYRGAGLGRFDMRSLSQRGQGLAEYALILSLVAILAVAALLFLSGQIDTILSVIGAAL